MHVSIALGRRAGALRQAALATVAAALVLPAFVGSHLIGEVPTAAAQDGAGPLNTAALTAPSGGVWLPGSLGGHFWVPDGALGFCRLEQPAGTLTNCDLTAKAPGQATFDAKNNVVYVADQSSKSSQVARLVFNPVTETVGTPSVVTFKDPNNSTPRPSSVAMGPDGNLYVASIKSNNIIRIIENPAYGVVGTAAVVGTTSDRKGVKGGLAFIGHDLYLSELGGSGVTAIAGIDMSAPFPCQPTAPCPPDPTSLTLAIPGAIASDGTYLYAADSPVSVPDAVYRWNPATDVVDVFSQNHPPYTCAADGTTVTAYKGVSGMGVAANGDLYVADDCSAGLVPNNGHLFVVKAPAIPDVAGAPGTPAIPPPPPGAVNANLYAWGPQAPIGGVTIIPGNLGGHVWLPDEQGFCRLDPVPGTGLHATNWSFCDDAAIGGPSQVVYDPTPNADGTHYLYAAEIDRFSNGVWRLTFDPKTESLVGKSELMVPGKLNGFRMSAAALGPDGKLYLGTLRKPNVYRIPNPRDAVRTQTVEVVAYTQGKAGITGPMAFLNGNLYFPEGNAGSISVVPNAAACTGGAPFGSAGTLPACGTAKAVPMHVAGPLSVAADTLHNLLYVADAPGLHNGVVLRWVPTSATDPTVGTQSVYVTSWNVPAAGTPEATVYCSTTCTRPWDPALTPGGLADFTLPTLAVDSAGTLYIGDDPMTGARTGHGRLTTVPYTP